VKSEKEIVREFAVQKCRIIVNAVRREFQTMRDCLQSGDDSGLESIWDEICVQVQGEESFMWEDAYIPTILQYIRDYIDRLDDYARSAIWYQTDHGWEYVYEFDNKEEQERILNTCLPDEDIAYHILHQVLSLAGTWSNPRIRAYLD
jgi:hypothetical protein